MLNHCLECQTKLVGRTDKNFAQIIVETNTTTEDMLKVMLR